MKTLEKTQENSLDISSLLYAIQSQQDQINQQFNQIESLQKQVEWFKRVLSAAVRDLTRV